MGAGAVGLGAQRLEVLHVGGVRQRVPRQHDAALERLQRERRRQRRGLHVGDDRVGQREPRRLVPGVAGLGDQPVLDRARGVGARLGVRRMRHQRLGVVVDALDRADRRRREDVVGGALAVAHRGHVGVAAESNPIVAKSQNRMPGPIVLLLKTH